MCGWFFLCCVLCERYSETGLFRTQKADGIMGLSINGLTLVPTLARHDLIPFKTFSLCFSRTGKLEKT